MGTAGEYLWGRPGPRFIGVISTQFWGITLPVTTLLWLIGLRGEEGRGVPAKDWMWFGKEKREGGGVIDEGLFGAAIGVGGGSRCGVN